MPGKNIQQLGNRTTPELTDFMYLAAAGNDYNVRLSQLKALFGIGDVEQWTSSQFNSDGVSYLNLISSFDYGAVTIEYLAKRGTRHYRAGQISVVLKGETAIMSERYDVVDENSEDLGLTITCQISSDLFQLICSVDNSDANAITFNYKIISKKPKTVV